MIEVNDIYLMLGKKRADDLAYDASGTSTVTQVIQGCIDRAYTWLLSKSITAGKTYDTDGITDSSKIQNRAVSYYAVYLLYEYAQSDITGEDDRVLAYNLLISVFGETALDYGDSENKPKKFLMGMTLSTGKKLDVSGNILPYNTYR